MATPDEQFRNLVNTAGEETEARLLFDVVTLGKKQSEVLETIALQEKQKMDETAIREQEERIDERKTQEILEGIQTAIEEKNTDEAVRTIIALGQSLKASQEAQGTAIVSAIEGKTNRDIVDAVAGLGEAVIPLLAKEDTPLDLTPVITANDKAIQGSTVEVKKGLDALAGGLVKIAEATKKNVPKDEVSVSKPSWWAPFSWNTEWLAPIQKTLERIANKEEQKLPIKDGRVLVDIGQTFPRTISGGGMGNPFSFDSDGNLKMTVGSDSWQEAYGKGIEAGSFLYWGYTSGDAWRIKARATTAVTIDGTAVLEGEIFWKSGDSDMAVAWGNKAVETHFSDYRRMI